MIFKTPEFGGFKNEFCKEAEHIDYEWHDGKMKTSLEYRLGCSGKSGKNNT